MQLKQKTSNWLLRNLGWKSINPLPPNIKKCIIIVAPHTSNYDFIFGILYKFKHNLKVNYLIKQEWVNSIIGPLFTSTGALKINRKNPKNIVTDLINTAKESNHFLLGITPEGTRKRVEKWKTGFYRIANEANLPIYCGYIDYVKKEMGFLEKIIPTGDQEKDLKKIQELYKNITPKNSENFNPSIF